MKKVIIIGAGGHAKVVADIVCLNGDQIVGYLDDKKIVKEENINVIGTTQDIVEKEDVFYFAAIGDNKKRKELMEKKVSWYTAIHPKAIIASSVEIGEGACVMANAVINPFAKIGRGAIINTSSIIEHDCLIENFVHISPGANIAGTVLVGECTWVGVGSIVINNVSICNECVIGAGAVVTKSIEEKGLYVGIPAEKIK